jgi:hypothetical protein
MNTEISTEVKGASSALVQSTPDTRLQQAGAIAKTVGHLIEQQGWFQKIGSGKHLRVEGWLSLASMFDLMPEERETIENADGSYTSYYNVLDRNTGLKVGSGSGMCGKQDDGHWAKKPAHQRRSMAKTRATSNALATCLRWVIAMEGYEPCPAEEFVEPEPQQKQASKTFIFDMGNDEHCLLLSAIIKKHHPKMEKSQCERLIPILHEKELTLTVVKEAISQL